MSEKLYSLLLRLHSSQFLDRYKDEALQLFRDRCRDERGFPARLRLWLDLLWDLAISVPRGYGGGLMQPQPLADHIPSFSLLASEIPNHRALLCGVAISILIPAAIPLSTGHPRAQRFPSFQIAPIPADALERRRIIQAVIANLNEHYIDPVAARKVADALLKHEQNGDYASVAQGAAFTQLLTRHMRDAAQDPHLDVIYSEAPLPVLSAAPPSAERVARFRQAMEQSNCTFEKVEILPATIGYIKLNFFPEPTVCEATAKAAMAKIDSADRVIFDLRDNNGGFGPTVMQISAYLFDHPQYMYSPRENTSRASWTASPIPGTHLAGKPAYILISSRTISAAEQFAFNMKMLKRATLIGETTRGAAHAGVIHHIDDHYAVFVRENNPINPYGKADWEGVGVQPDVPVKAADALEMARTLALRR